MWLCCRLGSIRFRNGLSGNKFFLLFWFWFGVYWKFFKVNREILLRVSKELTQLKEFRKHTHITHETYKDQQTDDKYN